MPKVLITGARGFIGKHLVKAFSVHSHWRPVAASRTVCNCAEIETRVIDTNLSPEAYQYLVAGCDAIIHSAARAHIIKETVQQPFELYNQINVTMTRHLAQAAINAGVKRFIFLSSAGVHGSETHMPFTEQDPLLPNTDYTRSKLEAEQELQRLAEGSGMEVTILRLPLVYGPGVKGNFLSMLKILERPLPLPLGSINNTRSLLYVDNLIDFIVRSLDDSSAANEVFLLSDAESVSTSELLNMINGHLGNKAWIFPFPSGILKVLAAIINQREKLEKLTVSFVLDSSKAQHLLHWHAPVSLSSAIETTVKAYQLNTHRECLCE